MKVIFILFLCFLVNLVSAQDFQYRIDSNVNTVKIDSIGKIIRELRNYNTKGNNRYLSYWEAYAYYKCAILSRVLKKEEDAEKFTEKAIEILESTKGKTTEDYALLGMLKNYQINFDKDIVLYNITIENEKSLEFTYETESKDSSVIINGNENLKNGSVITLIVTAVDGSTREYKFNISKIEEVKKDEPIVPHDKVQISKTNIIKIVISCASIVVSIISLLILNIIRIIKKKAMLWK